MKKLILLLFLLILSCKKESNFDLKKDLYQFSEKMKNGDTVVVEIDHSGCTARIFETYTFTKEKDKLHLTTFSGIDS